MKELNRNEVEKLVGGWGWIKSVLDWGGRYLTAKAFVEHVTGNKDYQGPTYGGGFGNCCDHLKNDSSYKDIMHDQYDRGGQR